MRDFSDTLWASYNYWCSKATEDNCGVGSWVKVGYHKRTPELFDAIIADSVHHISNDFSTLSMSDPCSSARQYFSSYVHKLWGHVQVEDTLIVASEDLSSNPERIWNSITSATGWKAKDGLDFKTFASVRYNAQVQGHGDVSAEKYEPGLYEASGFKPMLTSTRENLDRCWLTDCIWASAISRHAYKSCARSMGSFDAYRSSGNISEVLAKANISEERHIAAALRYMAFQSGRAGQQVKYFQQKLRADAGFE